jgi:glycosyltransferase involved in cell wall biosynthesis
MSIPTVSVIIPTIGRASLAKVLSTLVPQISEGDEIQVIGDGPQPEARKIVEAIASPLVKYDEIPQIFNYGNPQRNLGISRAIGQFLMFIDDDDDPYADGVTTVKRLTAQHPDRPHLFHIDYQTRVLPIPKDNRLYCGNVSGQCFIPPNVKGKLGKWSGKYEADLDFILGTLAFYDKKALVWHDEKICLVLPAGKAGIGRAIL